MRTVTRISATTIGVIGVLAIGALPAGAESPFNSTQGSVKGTEPALRGDPVDLHVVFSAWSDSSFQATQGASGSAGGMINVQPNAGMHPVVPPLGRVEMSCLNVQGNTAVMTGTVTEPISSNAYTGAPWYRPGNQWIVGAYLVVIDNGDTAQAQMYWGFFVNPDKNHAITIGRCFNRAGLTPTVLPWVEDGHVNINNATA